MSYLAQIISHTHWDREWYLNSKYTNEWLVPFFDQLFAMFEKEPKYQFVLDGQMSMIDDYIEELKKQNKSVFKYKELIRRYVSEGRLFIGPYYLQPDWQLISEEALVMNLILGQRKAKEYGKSMQVGWLLDNFGQISQTAQIHKLANLDGLYVWRGVEMDPEKVCSEFLWEAPDGTQIPSVYLLNSYRNVMRLAEYSDIMKERIEDEVEKLKDFMTTKNVLMMNGYDQEMVPDDILPYIKNGDLNTSEVEVIQSNPEYYLESVLKEEPILPTLKGALYSGRFIAVFPGVMSSRMYLKLQNDISQKAIEKYAEPLAMLDWLIGGSSEKLILDKAWELLLKNHPHDSICAVSIDDVHSDMEERSRSFHYMVDSIIEEKIRSIGQRIDTNALQDKNYFVYNPSAYSRSGCVEVNDKLFYLNKIGSMGYTYLIDSEVEGGVESSNNSLENNKLYVEVNKNGTYNIFHKDTKTWYRNLGMIEDMADAGDEYNYSYPDNDLILSSNHIEATITVLKDDSKRSKIEIRYDMDLPISLTNDRKSRLKETMKMPVRTVLTLDANTDVLKVKTDIRNTVKDHIVRVLFPTSIKTDYSLAGSPFDVVKRPISIEAYDESMIPANVKKVIVGAREAKPNTIFHGREVIDLQDDKKGLAVFNKGLPEYTVYKEKNTIALTLFRSVGWIAKDINTRIGDAGPEIFTPQAQCLREMSFEYAICPHGYEETLESVVRKSDLYNSELLTFVTNRHEGLLPLNESFIEVVSKGVKVTSIRKSQNEKGIVIRAFNATNKETDLAIKTKMKIKEAKLVNILEEPISDIEYKSNNLEFNLKPKKISTFYLELENESVKKCNNGYVEIIDNVDEFDFSNYPYAPLVTDEDILMEENRAKEMEEGLNHPMTRRSALEAKLSAILAKNRNSECEIHKLGYELNEARVERRIHDYIKDLKEKNN